MLPVLDCVPCVGVGCRLGQRLPSGQLPVLAYVGHTGTLEARAASALLRMNGVNENVRGVVGVCVRTEFVAFCTKVEDVRGVEGMGLVSVITLLVSDILMV